MYYSSTIFLLGNLSDQNKVFKYVHFILSNINYCRCRYKPNYNICTVALTWFYMIERTFAREKLRMVVVNSSPPAVPKWMMLGVRYFIYHGTWFHISLLQISHGLLNILMDFIINMYSNVYHAHAFYCSLQVLNHWFQYGKCMDNKVLVCVMSSATDQLSHTSLHSWDHVAGVNHSQIIWRNFCSNTSAPIFGTLVTLELIYGTLYRCVYLFFSTFVLTSQYVTRFWKTYHLHTRDT